MPNTMIFRPDVNGRQFKTGGKNKIVSKVVSPNTVSGLLFWDDFSSGNFSKTMNGCSWGSVTNVSVQSGFSSAGYTGKAAKFNFDVGLNGLSELRYNLGNDRSEIWFGMRLYMPSGAESPSVGPRLVYPDPGIGGQSGRNKLFRCWSKAQVNNRRSYPIVGAQWQDASNVAGTGAVDGDAGLVPSAGIYPTPITEGTVSQLDSDSRPFLTDATRGRWITLEMYAKASTGVGTNDGIVRWWLDGSLLTDSTGLNMFETLGAGFGEGYIMGAVDREFLNAGSCLYVDFVGFSETGRVFAQPFFVDSFSGGVTNPANGVTYSNPLGGLDNTNIVASGAPGAQVEAGYTHALRTTFPASARPGQTGNRQINFTLGRECDEFWLEWRVHIPSNYAHRNNYDPGPPYGALTDNNKFITLWGGSYSAGWHQPMCELETDGTIGANESDNKSYIKAMMRYSTETTRDFEVVAAGTLTTIEGDGQLLIGAGAPLTPGNWHTVRFHTRKESVQGTRDGVWRLWVNGALVCSLSGLAMGASDPVKFPRGVEYGYLLGYSNSGFAADTTFHTQWIKFYDTDPGW